MTSDFSREDRMDIKQTIKRQNLADIDGPGCSRGSNDGDDSRCDAAANGSEVSSEHEPSQVAQLCQIDKSRIAYRLSTVAIPTAWDDAWEPPRVADGGGSRVGTSVSL